MNQLKNKVCLTEGSDYSTNIHDNFVCLDTVIPFKSHLFQNYRQENTQNLKETNDFNKFAFELAEKGDISQSLLIFEKCLFFS